MSLLHPALRWTGAVGLLSALLLYGEERATTAALPEPPRPVEARPQADPQPAPPWDPIEAYEERTLEGWTILLHKDLLADDRADLCRRTLRLLEQQLFQITRAVPEKPLEKLRAIKIWVEVAHPKHPCMCYHVSPDWLRRNGMNPAKAGCVELANCENFLTWTRQQPWMVFHELAHGYHDQVLKFDNERVLKQFAAARDRQLYDDVLHWDGKQVRHYALTNHHEYFAEASEAFFGTNDFFPFVKAELRRHDPDMHALLEELWEVR